MAFGIVAQAHTELRVRAKFEDRRLHLLGFQVIAGDAVAAEEERGAIDDVSKIGGEVRRAASATALARICSSVPPSGSRLGPMPEMGSVLTPKTPTGLPVAFWNATA